MSIEHSNRSEADEVLARHTTLMEAFQGKRPMTWSDWALPLYDSRCLTPQGQQVALWAVETLRQALGDTFFQKTAPSLSHPIYSLGIWPGSNDVPWVYANLFQLAAQIRLLSLPDVHFEEIAKMMSTSKDARAWVHSLLQLEIASLGLKAGWHILFEPRHATGKRADVSLSNGVTHLLVETLSLSPSRSMRSASAFFPRMVSHIRALEWQYHIRVSGSLGAPVSEEEENILLQQVEAAACTVAQNGLIRLVSNSAGAQMEICREEMASETSTLEGAPLTEDVWSRLVERLHSKNDQATDAEPVWVRLDEYVGLWHFTTLQQMTLQERLDTLVSALQDELGSLPNLAGVILSPAVLWAGDTPSETLNARIEKNGGIALRCPIPGYRVRESILVAQAGQSNELVKLFTDWYEHEATWLDWALGQLGHPSFHLLVRDAANENNQE